MGTDAGMECCDGARMGTMGMQIAVVCGGAGETAVAVVPWRTRGEGNESEAECRNGCKKWGVGIVNMGKESKTYCSRSLTLRSPAR